jgi:hypothetical protein
VEDHLLRERRPEVHGHFAGTCRRARRGVRGADKKVRAAVVVDVAGGERLAEGRRVLGLRRSQRDRTCAEVSVIEPAPAVKKTSTEPM